VKTEQNLEGTLVSKAIETSVGLAFDNVEEIDVDIQTDILKLLQGEVDGVGIQGQGLEMQGVRIQELQLQTDTVSVNPLNAVFGKVEFDQPVNANARVVLTEDDLNRAMTTDWVRSFLQKGLALNLNGEDVTFKPQLIRIHLLEPNKIKVVGKILLEQGGATRPLTFQSIFCPRTETSPIILESFVCAENEGVTLDFVTAFIQKIKELTEAPHLEIDGTAFRVKKMEVEKGMLTLMAQFHLRKIPSSNKVESCN
jgi:LmeA-like phospholipid-binding